MSWAKIIGGAIGAAVGGPIGAGIGVALGAGFDHASEEENQGQQYAIGTGEAVPFQRVQVGNILRLTSMVSLPEKATHVVVRLGYGDYLVKSLTPAVADDDGYFWMRMRVLDRRLTFEIPLHALSLERHVAVTLTAGVIVFSEDESLGAIEFPLEVFVRNEQWSSMRWAYPIVDMAAHYALRSGPWTSEKVRDIKSVFERFIGDDTHEAQALRERLKLTPRPSLDESIAAINARFDSEGIETFVLPVAAGFIDKFGDFGPSALDETTRVGRRLRLDQDFIAEVVAELLRDDDSEEDEEPETHQVKGFQEIQWAWQILDLSRDADKEAVQKAWRKKISELHPDKYTNLPGSVQNMIKEKAQEINRARDILMS